MSELEQALEALGASVETSGVLLDYFPAGIAHRRGEDLDLMGPPSAYLARRGLGREEPSRARKGRYDHLTIFLLQ
jgi:hypothetical protein